MASSERLYYSDSFLRSFAAAVNEVRELESDDRGPRWQVALDRTAFYPASGGQPFDTGLLSATLAGAANLDIPVEQVEEDEIGAVWHFIRQPIDLGTKVDGRIDWERRFDHMQQHTGQHLLSAVFEEEMQASTVSFHLGEKISTIDMLSGPIAPGSLERVERIANDIIAEDRSVSVRYVSRAEAEAMLAAGELRKLPDREGSIRLVDIKDIDRNACGGTHVRSTGQIGGLQLRRVEKVSRGVRIEFVCGMRAIRTARADASVLTETAALLSTGTTELPAAVGRLLSDAKAGAKERQKLREELAAFQGMKLAAEEPIENGLRLVVRGWKDRDRDYLKTLAAQTALAVPATAVIFSAEETDPVRIFVARSQDLRFDCGRILKEALNQLGLRGGGSPNLAQGDVPRERQADLIASISDALRTAVTEAG